MGVLLKRITRASCILCRPETTPSQPAESSANETGARTAYGSYSVFEEPHPTIRNAADKEQKATEAAIRDFFIFLSDYKIVQKYKILSLETVNRVSFSAKHIQSDR